MKYLQFKRNFVVPNILISRLIKFFKNLYLLTDTVQNLRPPDFQVHAVLANGGYQISVFYLNAPNFDIFLQTGDEVVVDVIHLVVAVHNYN